MNTICSSIRQRSLKSVIHMNKTIQCRYIFSNINNINNNDSNNSRNNDITKSNNNNCLNNNKTTTTTRYGLTSNIYIQKRSFAKGKKKKGKSGGAAAPAAATTETVTENKSSINDDDDNGDNNNNNNDNDGKDEYINFPDVERRMKGAVDHLEREFKGLRSGKPDANMFNAIEVDSYGSLQPLNAVAQVTIKSPTMAILNIFDPSLSNDVVKAIKISPLDLDARSEAPGVVMVPLPKLSQEGRESMVKLSGKMLEKAKTSVRTVRKHGMDNIKKGTGVMSEDDQKLDQKKLEGMTEKANKNLQDMFEKKKKELLSK